MSDFSLDSGRIFKLLSWWTLISIVVILTSSGGIVYPQWVPLLLLGGMLLLAIAGLAYYQNETDGKGITLPYVIGWGVFVGCIIWFSRLF